MSIATEFDKAMSSVTGTDMQKLKLIIATGKPREVARALLDAKVVIVRNTRNINYSELAEIMNDLAKMAGRREVDILISDAYAVYKEYEKDLHQPQHQWPGADPVLVERIVIGTALEAAYSLFKGQFYQDEDAVRRNDWETIAAGMNLIATQAGRTGRAIHGTDVAAATTLILMGTPPATMKRPLENYMTPELEALRDEIIRDYSHLWELNDEGHRVEHFDAVFRCGMYLNNRLRKKYDPRLIMMAAFFHDLFAWSRKNHHLMSAQWIRTTDFPIMNRFNEVERKLIAIGCEEHRASRKEPFTHEFGELISSADRGFPASAEQLLMRALASRSKTDEDDATKRKRAIDHLKQKFGSCGYARQPEMYRAAFEEELEQQGLDVMALK